ncbi:alpha/beta hydrolase [Leptolyngbya sp. AN03gr2]|uniref:alpha/beta hydrolase n=1 Tax=unclassified Leptolyngbya TaxID=2650499 RepID=UPI003D323856
MSFLKNSVLGLGMALLVSTQAMAAERVTFKYKILRESVSVPELTAFAQTGQASPDLQTYFRLSGQRPDTVRQTLTRPIKVNPVLLDRVLNSPLGNGVLDQLGQAIQTPRGGAERQALRAALVLSASGDGTITILEILQNYPTQEVVVDGDRIEGAYRRLNEFVDRLRNPLGNIFR